MPAETGSRLKDIRVLIRTPCPWIRRHAPPLRKTSFMKNKEQKKYAGVCLDHAHAIIITNEHESDDSEYTILEKLKSDESHGGGSEHSMNNAKQGGEQKYFKAVSAQLTRYDEILIFGPGKSQEQFQNFLKADARFHATDISIDSADHLTDPQMIAKVREFFKKHQSN
jgi:stalled ribosome rescue protein Dom34